MPTCQCCQCEMFPLLTLLDLAPDRNPLELRICHDCFPRIFQPATAEREWLVQESTHT